MVASTVILLAAGRSQRMGISKCLMRVPPTAPEPWLTRQLRTLEEGGIKNCILVLGDDAEDIWRAVSLTNLENMHVTVVRNPQVDDGPFSSLQLGLKEALSSALSPYFWVLPVDTPCPAASTWKALASRTAADITAIIPTCNGKGGHPVLLKQEFCQRLVQLDPKAPDARLDHQLHKLNSHEKIFAAVDDTYVTSNLNTEADIAAFTSLF